MIQSLLHENGLRNARIRLATFIAAAGLLTLAPDPAAQSSDSATVNAALREQERQFRREYRTCTGDTATISLFELTAWRKRLHDTTETERYRALLAEYMEKTGRIRGISPCDVLRWEDARKDTVAATEDSLQSALLKKANAMVDSITAAREFSRTPASPFDFPGLHFGLSPHAVRYIFSRKYKIELLTKGDQLYTTMFAIRGVVFSVTFSFDARERFTSYEITGRNYGAELLNPVVRPQAATLVQAFEKRLGTAPHLFRIAAFDIKAGVLTPYARWSAESHLAVVGIYMDQYRYCAKSIVTRTDQSPLNQE